MLHDEATVNLRVALVVIRDGLGGDVLHVHARGLQRLVIRLEVAQVAAEDSLATRRQQLGHAGQQVHVIPLHAPRVLAHGLGIGERGRIHKNQVELAHSPAHLIQPLQHVRADEFVLRAVAAVQLHVAARPAPNNSTNSTALLAALKAFSADNPFSKRDELSVLNPTFLAVFLTLPP